MSGTDWNELLAEAQEELRAQEEVNSDLGDEFTPQPESYFMGRWRGSGKMQTKERGEVDVYLVWHRDGDRPGFLYQHARLVQEVEAKRPQVGDRVLVLRGPTETFEKDGEARSIFPYVLRLQECGDPLPGETTPPQQIAASDEPVGVDLDIPF